MEPRAAKARIGEATRSTRLSLPRLSAEPAAESIGDLDHDTIRIRHVGGPAARPINGGVAKFQSKPKVMDATDGLIDVVDDESDVIDVDAFRIEWPAGTVLDDTEVESVGGADDAPPIDAVVALLLEL